MKSLNFPRTVALAVVSTLVTLGVIVSFAESYRALYWWAQAHAVHGVWATLWPIQVDAFVAVGELALFVALVDMWKPKHRSLPWLIVGAGLAVSVAGNVGHVQTHDVFTRLTAAVPPLTAYVMLAAALGLLKRVVANAPKPPVKAKPGPKPGSTRKPKPMPTPEERVKAEAFATLPEEATVTGPLFRPFAPALEAAEPFDPDATASFPKLDVNGRPVMNGNGHPKA